MANVTIPPWLQPADVAGDYQRGLQIGSQVAEAQARLSQQAQETSTRLTMAAEQEQREAAVRQQQIQVTQAYHQEQAQLRQQQLAEIKAVNDQKTVNAARQFAARQQWQQLSSQIDNNPNLTDEQKDNAKSRAIMSLAPQMGTAGTEAAAMIRDLRPAKPTVPASVDTESNPDYAIVHQPNGTVSLHNKPKAASGGNVKVRLDPSTVVEMSTPQALATIANLPTELQKDPVNKAVVAGGYTPDVAKRQATIFGGGNAAPAKAKKYRFDHDKGLVPVGDN
jgi:hypothetical protein